MKIYVVVFDWATEDDHQAEVQAFTDELLARDHFDSLVLAEKDENLSWCGEYFTPEGTFRKDRQDEVDYTESNDYFSLEKFGTPYYSTISIQVFDAD